MPLKYIYNEVRLFNSADSFHPPAINTETSRNECESGSCFVALAPRSSKQNIFLKKNVVHPPQNWKQLAMWGFAFHSSPVLIIAIIHQASEWSYFFPDSGRKTQNKPIKYHHKAKRGPPLFFPPTTTATTTLSLFLKDVHSRYTRRCPTAPFSLCQQTQADDRSTQRSSVLWYVYLCSQRLIIIEIPRGWKISVMKRCWMNVCSY